LRKCTVLFEHNILRILRDKERVTGIAGNSTQRDIGERNADADARLEKQDYRGTAPSSTEKSCRSMSKAKVPGVHENQISPSIADLTASAEQAW
jgi:hypothetical protein